ncbi:MAG: polysaccharide lyase family 7 protein [Bacteroidota bacterium]
MEKKTKHYFAKKMDSSHNRERGFSTTLIFIILFLAGLQLHAQTPASNLGGLTNWKLNAFNGTLNISQSNNGLTYVDNKQPLSTHSNGNWFYLSNGYTYFKCHVGNPTSGGSGNPRSELREMTANGSNEIYWDGTTNTEHSMKWKVRVDRLPYSGKLAFGQIHDDTDQIDDAIRVQAQGSGNQSSGQIRIRILGFATDTDDNSNAVSTTETGFYFDIGETLYLELTMQNSIIKLYELNNSGSRINTIFTSNSINAQGCYYKAGCYLQSVKDYSNSDKSINNFGLVGISELSVDHSGGGGGSSCTATTPSNRSVSNVSSSSATVSWNAVANIDHYNVRWRETGTSTWSYKTSIQPGTTSHNITGLSSNDTYEWQVRAKCPDGSASSYNSGQGPNFTTSGSGGSGLPSPWQTTNIGNVSATGGASYSGSTFTIQGSGADIWNNSDEFRFVYQSMSGNGEVIAKVNSLTNTNSWAKAGVMIRESLSAGSKHAMTIVRPGSNGVSFQRRTSTNGSSAHSSKGNVGLAEWVRIVRSGNSFTSYHSNNGSSWTQIGSSVNISMSSSVYVGLCVTSHNDGTLTTASISNVSVSGGASVPSGNLALNKSTSQSTTDYGGVSSRAVDGNTNGNWNVGSITHTDPAFSNGWWEVDLGASYPIGNIVVWNRTNCCSFRLGNFTVVVKNSGGSNVWSQTVTSAPNPSTTVNANGASGRYIRIQQNLNEPLSLAEVQVYASGGNRFGVDANSEIRIFPNPAIDALNITGLESDLPIRIYGTLGNLVMEASGSKIDVSKLPAGIYFIKVEGHQAMRFIKH